MTINVDKCKHIRFGNKNPSIINQINHKPIGVVPFERDLGVFVDENLSFSPQISKLCLKLYYIAKGILLACSSTCPSFYKSMFNIYIRPVLIYGMPFWSPLFDKDMAKLSKVLNFFTTRVFPKCRLLQSDSSARLTFLGLETVQIMLSKIGLLYMFKIVHGLVEKPRFFPPLASTQTRGHKFKLYVEFSRLNILS